MKTDTMSIMEQILEAGQSTISDAVSMVDHSKIGLQVSTDQSVTVDLLNALSGISEIYGSEAIESDGTKTEYQLSHGWIKASTVSIALNGQPLNDFVAKDTGLIIFNTTPSAGTMVVSASYIPEDIDTVPLQSVMVNSGKQTIVQDCEVVRYLRITATNNLTSSASIVIKAVKN